MGPSIKFLHGILDKKDDRAVAVLGGGPALIEDIKKLPEKCTKISVNHHALKAGIDCAIMAFLDDPSNKKFKDSGWLQFVKNFKGIKITPFRAFSSYRFGGVRHWGGHYGGGFSSALATWLACYMGGDPVILCGMDCYQGSTAYCHEHEDEPELNRKRKIPIERHIGSWMPAKIMCPNPERIRAMSGPLVGTAFPRYNIEPVTVEVHDIKFNMRG